MAWLDWKYKASARGLAQHQILHGIDLSIADGEFVVFVGPSGCGKSTLLRTICGLENSDEGAVLIGGRDMTEVAPAARGIAMVFQSYALYPHMTVYDNMAFALKLAGLPQAEIRAKVTQAALSCASSRCCCASRRNCPAASASGWRSAERSCASRRCSCSTSRLSNLDAALRVQMRIELKNLHRDPGAVR
jgi:multiple sugar transport system ATP-binding protein